MTRRQLLNAALLGLLFSTVLVSCDYITVIPAPTPAPRANSSSEGSARWAFGLARESIEAEGFNADTELYVIDGVPVWNDGRLPANRGRWQFWFWNEASQLRLEIEVNYDGEITTTTERRLEAPTSRSPMPVDWVDSTIIFQAAPAFSGNVVDGALTNLGDWPAAPGGAYWVIGCFLSQSCPVYYVQWDGVYLGDAFP